jgi:hypothetical protein
MKTALSGRICLLPESLPTDIPKPQRSFDRNPPFFVWELQAEILRHSLRVSKLGQRHGVTSNRITQWHCLLKLPEEKQREIEALGDQWDRRVVAERALRRLQKHSILSDGYLAYVFGDYEGD